MELIYLYLNDPYKDIEIELNFSPKFFCKLDDNNQPIIEKNDYTCIENYYGEFVKNCNLILGDNGVGKSTVLASFNSKLYNREIDIYILYHIKDDVFALSKGLDRYKYFKYDYLFNKRIPIDYDDKPHIIIFKNNFYKYSKFLNYAYINEIMMSNYFKNIKLFESRKDLTMYITPKVDDRSNVLNHYHFYDLIRIRRRGLQNTSETDIFINSFINLIRNHMKQFNENQLKFDRIESLLNDLQCLLKINSDKLFVINSSTGTIPIIAVDFMTNNKELLAIFDKLNECLVNDDNYNRANFFDFSLSNFSSGEEQIVESILYILSEIKKVMNNVDNVRDFMIILDEPDTYLHPEWARKYMNMLIGVLNDFSKGNGGNIFYNLLVSSHSPFMVSDFFKERISVIRLDSNSDNPRRIVSTGKYGLMSNIIDVLMNDYYIEMPYGEYTFKKFVELRNKLSGDSILTDNNLSEIECFASSIDDSVLAGLLKRDLKLYKMRFKNDKNK